MNQPGAIAGLLERVAAADGARPLNESAELILQGLRDGDVETCEQHHETIAVCVTDPREQTIQLCVDPAHRRRGTGTRLLREALQRHPDFSVWAFGDGDGARGLARSMGLVPVRRLLRLQRPLDSVPLTPTPEGYRLDTYTSADATDVVRVNAAAFSHHPEQGKLTIAEFEVLTEQPWFDPRGLILARAATGELAGFHWTKQHDATDGEVYVICVHPDHEGRGLGRVLLEAGLARLREVGCTRVQLYVEATETRAVRMYESGRFEHFGTDVSYRLEDGR